MDVTSPSTAAFLQDACLQHRYIRTKDSSHIVERPEWLRAVKIGLSAALSRLEESLPVATSDTASTGDLEADSLVEAIEKLQLERIANAIKGRYGNSQACLRTVRQYWKNTTDR